LSNSGEQITLIDGSSNVIDDLTYDDNSAWGSDADGSGSSLELIIATANNSLSGSWSASSTTNGTPGTANSVHGAVISGNSGFRMMSSPVAGTVYDDILGDLWIQGMTNGDLTTGTANVWTFDVSGQSWTALTNLNTASQTAGEGYLVYVFADTDNDGDDDLPVTLSVAGTENSASATVGSITAGEWALVGNPYASTIDWDGVTQTNVATSAYVWDDANSQYNAWNGSAGDLTNGLIAPYQGFWVQASGGTGSVTIETADKSSSAGTFYKTMADSTGSMSFSITSGDYTDKAFVSFMNGGEIGMDNADAYKLLPLTPGERVVGISYADGNGLDISNLPYSQEGSISIPLDIMYLTVDDDYNFVTNENDITMSWDLSSLPETIIGLTLTDNTTNATTDLLQSDDLTFTTIAKGNFPSYGSGEVNFYPEVGKSQFTLAVAYSAALNSEEESTLPTEFALHQAYPNPFNPSATISFDIPAQTHSNASLRIYDTTGRLVATLVVDEQLASGTHTLQWQPMNLSSGLYIIQLKTKNRVFNQKITLVK
jgi:hypothetical protein